MFPKPLDDFLTKLGFDRDDKGTVANFFILFGMSGMITMMLGYTSWTYMTACCVVTTIVVLTHHYAKKYLNQCVDPSLSIPPK